MEALTPEWREKWMQARTLNFAKNKWTFLDVPKGSAFKKCAQTENTYAKRDFFHKK